MAGSKREMPDYGTSSSRPDGGRCWHTIYISASHLQRLVELSHHDNKDRVRFTNQV
jgi:hypothetical protein